MRLNDLFEAKIVGAAFLHTPTGRIIGKGNFHDTNLAMKDLGWNMDQYEDNDDKFHDMLVRGEIVDGFYTDDGRFMDRDTAGKAVKITDAPHNIKHNGIQRSWLDSDDVIWHKVDQIKEAQFRKPILMYHGTTTHALNSIKKQGVVPNPPAKYWDREKDPGSEAFPSRASIGGSYWTSNMMTAWSSATSAMRKFNSYPMIVCAMISEQASLADEDSQTHVISRAFAEMVHTLYQGLANDAYGVIAMYYFDDPAERERILETYSQIIHKLLYGTGPINRKLTDELFEAYLMRILAHGMEKSLRGSLYGIGYHIRRIQNQPVIPSTEEAETRYARVVDALSRRYRDSAFKDEHMPGTHTLRTDHVIGFRGAQKIVCILQLWDEQENLNNSYRRPMILHYGKVPQDFLDQYHERVSSSYFPGVMTPKGEWVIQPTEIRYGMAAESILEHTLGQLYQLGDSQMRTIGYWYQPRTGKHFVVDWGLSADKYSDESDNHHFDVFLQNIDQFGPGLRNQHWESTDDVVDAAVQHGWTRIGINNLGQLSIDAGSIKDGMLAARWMSDHHHVTMIGLSLVGQGYIRIEQPEDIDKFLKVGRLPGKPKSYKISEIAGDNQDHAHALATTGFWGRRGAGCLIMAQDTGRILLPLRSAEVEQPHTWGTFGGAIDTGEDPAEAARREAQEEAGIRPRKMIPLFVFKSQTFQYFNFLGLIPHEVDPRLNWESQDARWVYPGEWPKPLHFGVEALLRDPKSIHTIRTLRKKFRMS